MPTIPMTRAARRALTLLFCLSSLGASVRPASAADTPPIVLVPQPASMTPAGGSPFELKPGVQIVASPDHNAKDAAAFLAAWLQQDTGMRIQVVVAAPNSYAATAKGAIVVTETGGDRGLGDEGYGLTVTPRNITIRAPHGTGLFYGGETIRQLLQKPNGPEPAHWTIPAVTIRDQPRYPERSLMIDSARHFQSVAFLKRTLDLLAYHKMNTMHWHLTDDQGWRLQIKQYPKLTEIGAYRKDGAKTYGAFYSQDQVRDLVAYADARHITIVPELDMPAHCISLLAAYPENACFPRAFEVSTAGISNDTPGSPDVLCAGREETYTFMENILGEVMALFPSKAIHIGGDECPTVRWKTCPVCQAKIKTMGLRDERALQSYFTNRIAVFLTAHGRRLQGWNEILEGGTLPKDVIVQPWNRPESAAAAARAGNDVVVSSTRYGYFDYSYKSISLQRVYEWNPTPAGLTGAEAERIKGLEACLWTEGKKDDADADYFIWPRTLAIAEDGWSPMAQRDWPGFKERLETVHYARLAAMGLGNPAVTDPKVIEAALVSRSGFNANSGVRFGEWLPSQMSETFTNLDWPLDPTASGPGKYSVRFDYTDGACGIAIANVDLVRNGTEVISSDTHDAFAGGSSHGETYTVTLPTVDPESKYTLRVRLRSDGGTDSKGSLFLTVPAHKAAPSPTPQPVPSAKADTFELKDGKFVLNGKPFVVISGEMHYERIPREYWRHRLRMAKAMGLNTIATYVFWNMQEPEKGEFDFSGNADLASFVKIAQEEGLYILLRTGPYACAEWEYGGYPYWLLNETTDGKPLVVRSTDPNFLRYSARFIEQVGVQCAPLQAGRGGNILMVQVENEYGSFGKDKVYMAAVRDMIRSAGFTVPLYTADGPSQMPNGDIEGALPCLDGASASGLAATIDKAHPGGPYFASETYPGWLDHWGEKFNRNNPEREAKALTSFVEKGYSVNLYMFHGGTNFGFMNGANTGGTFEPSITSYDYGAPLDEAGRPTKMYGLMRAALEPLVPVGSLPPIPALNPIVAVPRFSLTETGSLLGTLPKPVESAGLKTMEDLNQAYGFVLYRTQIKTAGDAIPLTIKGLRDYAVVMVNGKTVGTLDRRRKQQTIALTIPAGGATLDLLVENEGRVNYGGQIRDNHKGITGAVTLGGDELSGWSIYSLPMVSASDFKFDGKTSDSPTLYRGTFHLDSVGDTFLDLRGWTKGVVWVNGHNLGRYWFIGPQQTLYVPGPWLKAGDNQIVVFEEVSTKSASVEGLTEPVLEQLVPEAPIPAAAVAQAAPRPKFATPPQPTAANQIVAGDFTDGTSTQTIHFPTTKARYVCFESTSAFDGSDFASCAEFDLLGANDRALPRHAWHILYTDSEEDLADDNKADNMIDGDDATFWHSLWGRPYTKHPHYVVIDLGATQEFTAFRYAPRQSGDPGRIKGYAFFASDSAFGGR